MANHKLLRLSATLLVIGEVLLSVASSVHPCAFGGSACTTEQANFIVYATSSSWAAIHLVQFVGTAVVIAGLLVLYFALGETSGTPRWLGFFAALAAGVALALAGLVYAVDGVALKQVVDAWVSAPASQQAARFAGAEAIRSLEWGARSYQAFTFGLALVLLATTIVWTAKIPRPIGYVLAVIGLAWMATGWLQGAGAFTTTPSPLGVIVEPTYFLLFPAWMIWLLLVAWLRKESVQAAPA
jgi:hypothetical protein